LSPTRYVADRKPIPEIRWSTVGDCETVKIDLLFQGVAHVSQGAFTFWLRDIFLPKAMDSLGFRILRVKFQV
jgi:hypothetical protein